MHKAVMNALNMKVRADPFRRNDLADANGVVERIGTRL